MNISRIIIADNQPLTALAVETLCKRLTTNGHNQEAEIVYATNKYELGVLLKQRVNCALSEKLICLRLRLIFHQ